MAWSVCRTPTISRGIPQVLLILDLISEQPGFESPENGYSENMEVPIAEAERLLNDGLVNAATQLLEELIEDDPVNIGALRLIGRAYLVANKPEIAADYLRRSLDARRSLMEPPQEAEFTANDANYYADNQGEDREYIAGLETGLFEIDEVGSEAEIGDSQKDFDLFVDEEESDTLDNSWIESGILTMPVETEDWENIVFDDQFVDVEEESIDYDQFSYSGRLTPEERARQMVGEYAAEFNIDEPLFELLTEILAFHKCHGQTKKAIRALLVQGVYASDLRLVFELREFWQNREAFSRTYYGDTVAEGYINLSWGLGLAIITCLRCDDVEEALMFVEDCFEDWSHSTALIAGFHSFRSYMLHIVEHTLVSSGQSLPPFIEHWCFELEDALPADFPGSPIYKWLEENERLAREPVPYYPPLAKIIETPVDENGNAIEDELVEEDEGLN